MQILNHLNQNRKNFPSTWCISVCLSQVDVHKGVPAISYSSTASCLQSSPSIPYVILYALLVPSMDQNFKNTTFPHCILMLSFVRPSVLGKFKSLSTSSPVFRGGFLFMLCILRGCLGALSYQCCLVHFKRTRVHFLR